MLKLSSKTWKLTKFNFAGLELACKVTILIKKIKKYFGSSNRPFKLVRYLVFLNYNRYSIEFTQKYTISL